LDIRAKLRLSPAFCTLLVLCGIQAASAAQPNPDATRGELLYAKHCFACHGKRIHWREKRLITDWKSLHSEVRRWQSIAGLGWSEQDIADVARYLNTLHYRYPAPD